MERVNGDCLQKFFKVVYDDHQGCCSKTFGSNILIQAASFAGSLCYSCSKPNSFCVFIQRFKGSRMLPLKLSALHCHFGPRQCE